MEKLSRPGVLSIILERVGNNIQPEIKKRIIDLVETKKFLPIVIRINIY